MNELGASREGLRKIEGPIRSALSQHVGLRKFYVGPLGSQGVQLAVY
jgi:hypothetical protein